MSSPRAVEPENSRKLKAFKPVFTPHCTRLILGSMPGVESLRQQQYYAHPRNLFWRLAGELFGFDATLPYDERLAALSANNVALWDVLSGCRRVGSLDSNITDPEPNDIAALLRKCPQIRLIACNGTTAHTLFKRYNPAIPDTIRIVKLPSSSPAHATLSYLEKLKSWQALIDIGES